MNCKKHWKVCYWAPLHVSEITWLPFGFWRPLSPIWDVLIKAKSSFAEGGEDTWYDPSFCFSLAITSMMLLCYMHEATRQDLFRWRQAVATRVRIDFQEGGSSGKGARTCFSHADDDVWWVRVGARIISKTDLRLTQVH